MSAKPTITATTTTAAATTAADDVAAADAGISLYIHVPFCQTKCPYCDFNTYQGIESLVYPYLEALSVELTTWGRVLNRPAVNTIFFGGGTPSYLPDGAIGRILDAAGEAFLVRPDAEITIEANPGDLTFAKAQSLLAQGVNRLSIGVQSLGQRPASHAGPPPRRRTGHCSVSERPRGRICQRQSGPDVRPAPTDAGPMAGTRCNGWPPWSRPIFPCIA